MPNNPREIFSTKWLLLPINKKWGKYIGVKVTRSNFGDYLLIGKGTLTGEIFNTKGDKGSGQISLPLKHLKEGELEKAIKNVKNEFGQLIIRKTKAGDFR